MSVCGECDYYGMEPEEARDKYCKDLSLDVKARCFCSPPYPNCALTGQLTRPVVYAAQKACRYFKEKR